MFTGLVEGLGTIKRVTHSRAGVVLAIEPDFPLEDPGEGESVAVNGVCLTATTISPRFFTADVSPETLSRSTLGAVSTGSRVNLERALRLSDRLGGHMVSGHVDTVGEVVARRSAEQFILFTFAVAERWDRYLIEKGSVAIDGVSLTVNSCERGRFSVSVIPHSAAVTTLGLREAGHKVNIEFDIIGKYIEKLLLAGRTPEKASKDIDVDLLARHGFL